MIKMTGLFVIGLICISACTTQPVKNVEYFILSNGNASSSPTQQQKPIVVVNQIILPSYLDTSNLAMQLSDHQIYYSKQHFWAEPLKTGMTNALLEDLNGSNSNNVYLAKIDDAKVESPHKLGLHIRQFMPTYQSTVILNGQYWLVGPASDKNQAEVYSFAYEVELEEDGYRHSVSKMRALLRRLSTDILNKVEK